MSGSTPNIALYLPGGGSTGLWVPDEVADIDKINQNMQKIDTAIGDIWGMANPANQRFRSSNTSDASLSSTGHGLQIGPSSGANLRMDNNEIMAVNNAATANLGLQAEGGTITLNNAWTMGQVVPTALATAGGGSGSIDSDGKVTLNAVGSARLTELFTSPGADALSVFEFFWFMLNSDAPGSSQPLFIGLSSGVTSRSTLRSVYRGFSDTTAQTLTFGGSGTDVSDASIGMTGNVNLTGCIIHGLVYNALSTAERTKIIIDSISDQDGVSRWDSVIYNTTSQVDDGLRVGRGGTGLVTGYIVCRRIS